MSTVPSAATVSRLEKVAVDNGFNRELGRKGGWLGFASSQAPPPVEYEEQYYQAQNAPAMVAGVN